MSLRAAAGPGRERRRLHGARPAAGSRRCRTRSCCARAAGFDRVLVVDETRRSGGVSESVVAALVDGGYTGRIGRVTSADSFIPLGPAADHVLLSEAD